LKRFISEFGIYIFIILIVLGLVSVTQNDLITKKIEDKTYTDLVNFMSNGDVTKLEIKNNDTGLNVVVRAYVKDDSTKAGAKIIETKVPDVRTFQTYIDEIIKQYPSMKVINEKVDNYDWLVGMIPTIVMVVLAIVIISVFLGQGASSSGSRMSSFGKSRAKMCTDELKNVNFGKVAGLNEEKEELREIVEFLKEPKRFIDMGARIPKGVLLVGPPGTGKTLLGKAVAGEAGVPFFSISGSDFVEMFVGVGASRVRDLFEQAKKNSPCIVFIDEIDAVGRKRGAGLGGGHDEREQTLNQLLVEMDGFTVNQGVIILAATNRADILDSALLRPGRFDRTVYVGRPDVKGREQILKVHAEGKPIDKDVDFETISKTTAGFTGADLENLLNEAAIIAAKNSKKKINMSDIEKAFVKVGIGTEKKSRVISEREKRVTAYHEAGHAILHHVLSDIDEVHSISIIPTGFAGGYTMPLPKEDRLTLTKQYMKQQIISLLGGRVAEELKIGDITTGASNDIERATSIARSMVTRYGMSEKLGPILYGEESGSEVFIGRDWGHTKNYGEDVARIIDDEVKNIIAEQYKTAIELLNKYNDVLERTADELMLREKLTGDEFKKIFNGEELPEFVIENNDSDTSEKQIRLNLDDISDN